jgi:hypothetical protein
MPVLDPEKLLKSKGYLRQTFASAGKVYQPRVMQVNVKSLAEELSLKEKFKQVRYVETSTSKSEVKIGTPEDPLLRERISTTFAAGWEGLTLAKIL